MMVQPGLATLSNSVSFHSPSSLGNCGLQPWTWGWKSAYVLEQDLANGNSPLSIHLFESVTWHRPGMQGWVGSQLFVVNNALFLTSDSFQNVPETSLTITIITIITTFTSNHWEWITQRGIIHGAFLSGSKTSIAPSLMVTQRSWLFLSGKEGHWQRSHGQAWKVGRVLVELLLLGWMESDNPIQREKPEAHLESSRKGQLGTCFPAVRNSSKNVTFLEVAPTTIN
jgi:hypothetical protein